MRVALEEGGVSFFEDLLGTKGIKVNHSTGTADSDKK